MEAATTATLEHKPSARKPTPNPNFGWFKAMRGREPMELIKLNPHAFTLAYVIASRARWCDGFNADGLSPGEAMLGDYATYGMSERQYRTAKKQLTKGGFATFKATNKGTIGKLTDTRLFSVLGVTSDGQNDRQATDDRRTGDGRATTNKINKNREEGKNVKSVSNFLHSPEGGENMGVNSWR